MSCEVLSCDWVLRMQRGSEVHYTLGYGFDINTAAADRIGNDKTAQYELLRRASVPAIAHLLARTPGDTAVNRTYLPRLDEHTRYVTKPTGGSGGDDIRLHTSLDEAVRYIDALPRVSQSWAISPYEELRYERRFVMLDDEVLLCYEKTRPTVDASGLTLFNLGQGAQTVEFVPSDVEIALAQQAAQACTLRLAAIDIVGTANGEQKIMEINSGIMCESYAQQSPEHFAAAQEVYRQIVRRIFAD